MATKKPATRTRTATTAAGPPDTITAPETSGARTADTRRPYPSVLMLYRDNVVICGSRGCRWSIETEAAKAAEKINAHRSKHLQEAE